MKISETAQVAAPQKHMFNVIYDIALYHTFIPWCHAADYLDAAQHATYNSSARIAYIDCAIGPVKYRLTTKNTANYPQSIELSLLSGPLKNLHGKWLILPLTNDSCTTSVEMELEWQTGMLQKAISNALGTMCLQLTGIFKTRAELLAQQSAPPL